MKKLITFTILLSAIMLLQGFAQWRANAAEPSSAAVVAESPYPESSSTFSLYEDLCLDETVNYIAFSQAVAGMRKIPGVKNKDLLVVIDFSKPSTQERMCVVDLGKKEVLYRSHVAHGRNSGGNYATSFSNTPGSYQSSLGFFVTESTYTGRNGYSLVLNGLEKGINDKAKERAIVMHGATYCDPSFITGAGRLGRSHGCPALPPEVSREIIDTIKDGVVLYIHADDEAYREQSVLIR